MADRKLLLELLDRSARRHGSQSQSPAIPRLEAALNGLVVERPNESDSNWSKNTSSAAAFRPQRNMSPSPERQRRTRSLPGRLLSSRYQHQTSLSSEVVLANEHWENRSRDETNRLRWQCYRLERMLQQLVNTELWTQNRHICRLEQRQLLQQQRHQQDEVENQAHNINKKQLNLQLQQGQRCVCCGQFPVIVQEPLLQNMIALNTTSPAPLLPDYSAVNFFHSDAAEDDYDTAAEQSPWRTGDEEESESIAQQDIEPPIKSADVNMSSISTLSPLLRRTCKDRINSRGQRKKPPNQLLRHQEKVTSEESRSISSGDKILVSREQCDEDRVPPVGEDEPKDDLRVVSESVALGDLELSDPEGNRNRTSGNTSRDGSWSSDSTDSLLIKAVRNECIGCQHAERLHGDLRIDNNVARRERKRRHRRRRREQLLGGSSQANVWEVNTNMVNFMNSRPMTTMTTVQQTSSSASPPIVPSAVIPSMEDMPVHDTDDKALQEHSRLQRENLRRENRNLYMMLVRANGWDLEEGSSEIDIENENMEQDENMEEDQFLEQNRRDFLATKRQITRLLPRLMESRLEISSLAEGERREPIGSDGDGGLVGIVGGSQYDSLKENSMLFERLDEALEEYGEESQDQRVRQRIARVLRGILEDNDQNRREMERELAEQRRCNKEYLENLQKLRERIVRYEREEIPTPEDFELKYEFATTNANSQNKSPFFSTQYGKNGDFEAKHSKSKDASGDQSNQRDQKKRLLDQMRMDNQAREGFHEFEPIDESVIMSMDSRMLVNLALPYMLERFQNALAEDGEQERRQMRDVVDATVFQQTLADREKPASEKEPRPEG